MPDRKQSPRPRFAILGSGRGSNAVALMQAFAAGSLPAELAVVISNVAGAPILQRAAEQGYPASLVESIGRSRAEHEAQVCEVLRRYGVDHLLLAGYLRVLSPEFVARFPGFILNIHPSLVPEFPGLHAVAAQWRAGVRVAGATVHFVDAGIDTGPTLLSGAIDVRGDEGEAGVAGRILTEVEHSLYPRALRLLLERMARGGPLPARPRASSDSEIPAHPQRESQT
jgi:phosphoribosylglycinamide formyltransferase-1